jgi:hypothetical protein
LHLGLAVIAMDVSIGRFASGCGDIWPRLFGDHWLHYPISQLATDRGSTPDLVEFVAGSGRLASVSDVGDD